MPMPCTRADRPANTVRGLHGKHPTLPATNMLSAAQLPMHVRPQ